MNTHVTTPASLYHYASIDVFQSIIATQTLRATRYDQLNDWSELRLGTDRLLEAVKAHGVDDSLRDFKDFLTSGIEDFQDGTLDVFVASFSEGGNSLDLRGRYTPGGGVTIGFDFERVREGFLCDISGQEGQMDLAQIVATRFFKGLTHSF